jgi:hypothetical protein
MCGLKGIFSGTLLTGIAIKTAKTDFNAIFETKQGIALFANYLFLINPDY